MELYQSDVYDEFCDPDNPRPLQIEDVKDAAVRIKSHIINTPCMPSHYQKEFVMKLYYKLEILQKSGSFKDRGVLNLLKLIPFDVNLGIVIASLGNEAIGMCYYASKLKIPVIVVMPTCVSPAKLKKCYSLGAKVTVQGGNLVEAQKVARVIARDRSLTYINSRDHPDILAGYGTVALEILEQVPFVDAVIVPIGSGGLIAGVATVIKHFRPKCLVYGVELESMSVYYDSLENGELTSVLTHPTIADGIAVTQVGVNSFYNSASLLDRLLLVDDDYIARSILHLMEKERLVVEGAGACSLAAIMSNQAPELKLKHVVCILSGGNIDPIVFPRCLERGLSAEGRLIKFRVGIKDSSVAQTELMKLVEKAGYNVFRLFQEHRWLDNDVYRLEVQFVCEVKNLQHGLELKKILERAYPYTITFENEPFHDKKKCPCLKMSHNYDWIE